ncbi:MAG TPA: hypothetical protein PLM22_08170 [Candidatus Sabulitectum sp.]|nr:hypothetical protein [Candidatus Sabulitectum sp.]HPF32530.1 hypothetical protein [Candidatus Sabulitectum sp.]HPJ28894.1 hypothetical protein [Candidatus Sabulitectum sp.]HPR22567.1 hypothetical protein [Candidatus Sabulitectum sp.]HRW77169.1 hypothetical protein [Candidatus Sabulitectum sp.]
MRYLFIVLLVLCVTLAFGERTGSSGYNPPAQVRGTYTVVESFAVGLSSAYGLAIQREIPNSIWISQYTPVVNHEFDMGTGTATGNTWPIDSGVDPDDMGYCEYAGSPNQFFFGDWAGSNIAIYDVSTTGASPYFMKDLAGPAGWQAVCGVAAGHGNLYASNFFTDVIAWGDYTGTESTVTWSTASFASVSGMSVYMDWLFVACQITGSDNLFIFELNPDGSPNMTPVWSTTFTESTSSAGGVDYDGEYLWVYPQNDNLFKLDIDWAPSALDRTTWGAIKATF